MGGEATLSSGTVIGDYTIERRIGSGGMGVVYEVRHNIIGRRAAMKVLRADRAGTDELEARFLREARAVNLIRHDNIIDIYDFGRCEDGSPYFVMELLQGESLDALIAREAPLRPAVVVHVFSQVARALAAAHEARIVHRDLKPDNVILIARGGDPHFAKLLDFGVAQFRAGGAETFTSEGVLMGTPRYMSPEQARGRKVDARTDIFSLGVMLYQACTGVMPFRGESLAMLLEQIMTATPEPPHRAAPGSSIPEPLEGLILRALGKDPDQRFPDAGALLATLEAIGASFVHPPGPPQWTPPRPMAPPGMPGPMAPPGALAPPRIPGPPPRFYPPPESAHLDALRHRAIRRMILVAAGVGLCAVTSGIVLTRSLTRTPGPARAVAHDAGGEQTLAALYLAEDRGREDSPGSGDGPAHAGVHARALAALTRHLDAPDPATQRRVIAAIALAGAERAAPVLAAALARGPQLRLQAAGTIRDFGLRALAPEIARAAEQTSAGSRIMLSACLAALGSAAAAESMQGVVDGTVRLSSELGDAPRLEAALALQSIGRGEAARPVLEQTFARLEPSNEAWQRAARGLLAPGSEAAQTRLEAELGSPVRERAVRAAVQLVRAGDSRALELLASEAADPDSPHRAIAALALAENGHESALAGVESLLASASANERAHAVAVAARLAGRGGEAFGPAIAALAEQDPDLDVRLTALAALLRF